MRTWIFLANLILFSNLLHANQTHFLPLESGEEITINQYPATLRRHLTFGLAGVLPVSKRSLQ